MPLLHWGDEPPRAPVTASLWLFCRTCLIAVPIDMQDPTAAIYAALVADEHEERCPGTLMSRKVRP